MEEEVKRIKTTMIGSIDLIEKKFAELINNSEDFNQKFQELRKEILDLGNNQIRIYKKNLEKK